MTEFENMAITDGLMMRLYWSSIKCCLFSFKKTVVQRQRHAKTIATETEIGVMRFQTKESRVSGKPLETRKSQGRVPVGFRESVVLPTS